MQDGDRPSVMDATGGVPGASPRPPASRVGWAMEKPWEMPAASARALAAAKIPTAQQGAMAPLSLPAPSEGKLSPAPLISRPFLRAGQEGAARPPPAPPYLLPGPLPPALPGSPLLRWHPGAGQEEAVMPNPWVSPYPGRHGTAQPHILAAPSTAGSPKGTTKPRLWPCLPFPPSSLAGAGYLHSLCKRDFIIAFSQPISILVIGVVLISVWLGVDGGPAMLQR